MRHISINLRKISIRGCGFGEARPLGMLGFFGVEVVIMLVDIDASNRYGARPILTY